MRRNILIFLIFIISSSILASSIHAQEPTSIVVTDPKEAFEPQKTPQPRATNQKIRPTIKEEIKQDRMELRKDVKELRTTAREDIKKMREDVRETIKEKKDEFKNRLQTIKDEKKAQIVERLDGKMTTINTNQTDKMLTHIEKMESIIERLNLKIVEAEGLGKDVSAAKSLITQAEAAIADAKSAVTEQAGKDYTPEITDETTLGEVVSTAMTQLRTDLSALHTKVIAAKQSVITAATEVAKLRPVKSDLPEPTISQ